MKCHVARTDTWQAIYLGCKPACKLWELLNTTASSRCATTNVLVAHITGEYLQRLHTKGASQRLRNGKLDEDRWSKPRVRR